MSEYEAQDADAPDEVETGDDASAGGNKAQRDFRQQALRDLGRAQKLMRSEEASGPELLLRAATVRAILDLADAIRSTKE